MTPRAPADCRGGARRTPTSASTASRPASRRRPEARSTRRSTPPSPRSRVCRFSTSRRFVRRIVATQIRAVASDRTGRGAGDAAQRVTRGVGRGSGGARRVADDPERVLGRDHGPRRVRLGLRRHPARRHRLPADGRDAAGRLVDTGHAARAGAVERTWHHRQDARRRRPGRDHPDGQQRRGSRAGRARVPLRAGRRTQLRAAARRPTTRAPTTTSTPTPTCCAS